MSQRQAAIVSLDEFTKIPRLTLRTLGVDFTDNGLRITPLFYITIFSLVFCIACEVLYLVFGAINGTADFRVTIHLSFCIVNMTFATALCVEVQFGKHKFESLGNKFKNCFPTTLNGQNEYRVEYWATRTTFMMKLFAIMQIGTLMFFNLFSAGDVLEIWIKENRWAVDFLYPLWYPFNAYQRGIFEICYFHQIFTSILTVSMVLAFDLLICGWVEQLRMHQFHLRKAFVELNSSQADGPTEKRLTSKYVQKHCLIYEYETDVIDIF